MVAMKPGRATEEANDVRLSIHPNIGACRVDRHDSSRTDMIGVPIKASHS